MQTRRSLRRSCRRLVSRRSRRRRRLWPRRAACVMWHVSRTVRAAICPMRQWTRQGFPRHSRSIPRIHPPQHWSSPQTTKPLPAAPLHSRLTPTLTPTPTRPKPSLRSRTPRHFSRKPRTRHLFSSPRRSRKSSSCLGRRTERRQWETGIPTLRPRPRQLQSLPQPRRISSQASCLPRPPRNHRRARVHHSWITYSQLETAAPCQDPPPLYLHPCQISSSAPPQVLDSHVLAFCSL